MKRKLAILGWVYTLGKTDDKCYIAELNSCDGQEMKQ